METSTARSSNSGGAPLNNSNRTSHGVRAWESVKRLPKGAGHVRRALYAERDELRREVVAQHGGITMYRSAVMQSALRHSGRAQLLERWLRLEDSLTLAERLAVLKEIGAATDSRDRCLKALGLDTGPDNNPWAFIDERGGQAS
jgi:hypothetical protein